MTGLLPTEPLIQKICSKLWGRMIDFADHDMPVPLHDWVNFLTFDVVGSLAFGGPVGFVDQGRDVDGIIKSIHDGFWLMASMGNFPLQMAWFNNPLALWMSRSLGSRRINAFPLFLEWLDARVEERYQSGLGDKPRDLLQHFIEAKDMDGKPVVKGDVMIEGVTILSAGADTTAIGILAVLGALLLHPGSITRLQTEIDDAYAELGLDGDSDELSFTAAEKLPYLSAVIKESTRLHPSVQYQLPRYAPEGGAQIGNYHVPEGTICGISPKPMNRSKEIFGEDADEWRPERWIASDPKQEEKIRYWNTHLTTVSNHVSRYINSAALTQMAVWHG